MVPFAAVGGFSILWQRAPEKLLVVIYCVVAWFVAMLTIAQAGGSINYFWEPLFASAVLAGPGLYELQRKANYAPIHIRAVLFVLILWSSLPMLYGELYYFREVYKVMSDYQAQKSKWQSFVSIVSGRRLLSTMPDVTYHSMIPEIPDRF